MFPRMEDRCQGRRNWARPSNPLKPAQSRLSDQRQERVDVRVLPVIFRVEKPKDLNLYPGLLVDIYIGE
jgi:hypothetical protein